MQFLPDKRFVIDAGVGPDEVRDRLRTAVAPVRRFALRRPTLPFAGTVGSKSFELRPVLGYGNSFAPLVQGSYATVVSGIVGLPVTVPSRTSWAAPAITMLDVSGVLWLMA